MVTHESLAGLWTRSLIVWPDGHRDTTTCVAWLQGARFYIDLRQPAGRPDFSGVTGLRDLSAPQVAWLATQEGFAGVLENEEDCFVWRREIDFQPEALHADAGRLRFEHGYMVEEGRDIAYVEHWHHQPETPPLPRWGARLSDPATGRIGMILRVGTRFMLAISRLATLPPRQHLSDCVARASDLAAAQDLVDCEISLGRVGAAGWLVERSSLPYREGRALTLAAAGERLEITASDGEHRAWNILEQDAIPDSAVAI